MHDLRGRFDRSRKCPWPAADKNTFISGVAGGCQSIYASRLLGASPAGSPSAQFAFTSWANDNQKMRRLLSPPNLIQKKLATAAATQVLRDGSKPAPKPLLAPHRRAQTWPSPPQTTAMRKGCAWMRDAQTQPGLPFKQPKMFTDVQRQLML